MGHSMGAAGLSVALLRGLHLDAAVFVAPPRSPAGFFGEFSRALGLRSGVERATRERLERRVGMPLVEFDIPRMAEKQSAPLLVVHDRDDREIPWTDGAAIAEAWPGARMVTTEGLGHRRILRDPAVAAHAASFVAERLLRCGCGRLASEDSSVGPVCAACALERDLFERPGRAA
jgi:pimeloyl-ACP methyl ester carboxylesterase